MTEQPKKKRKQRPVYTITVEIKIRVIELFLSHNENGVAFISEQTGISKYKVSIILDSYFEKGALVVPSKINNPRFK